MDPNCQNMLASLLFVHQRLTKSHQRERRAVLGELDVCDDE